MATGENIRKLRLLCGMTLDQLSELSGVEVGTISALENRDSSRSKFFPVIAKAFGISTDDLSSEITADQIAWAKMMYNQSKGDSPADWMTAKEIVECVFDSSTTPQLQHDKKTQPNEHLPQPTEDEFALVQQLDLSASCGHGRFTEHVVVKGGLAFKRSSLRDIGIQEDHARVIYATGESMEPSIGHGRVVLIDTADKKASDNKIFLICDPDGSILLKRLVREFHPGSGDMRWIMRSDNPNKTQYPDKLLPDDERTHIVGRAVWTDKML